MLTDERIETVVREMGFIALDPYKFARTIYAQAIEDAAAVINRTRCDSVLGRVCLRDARDTIRALKEQS